MKFYLFSDDVDTQLGFRLVGIEGEVVNERIAFLQALEEKMRDSSIGIIMITTTLMEMCPEAISEIKLTQRHPLLVEIPNRHGDTKIGETIDQYVSDTTGITI